MWLQLSEDEWLNLDNVARIRHNPNDPENTVYVYYIGGNGEEGMPVSSFSGEKAKVLLQCMVRQAYKIAEGETFP